MSTIIRTLCLTALLGGTISFGEKHNTKLLLDSGRTMDVSVNLGSTYSSRHEDNLDHSHISIDTGNLTTEWQTFFNNLEKSDLEQINNATIWEFSIRLSTVPLLLADKVGEEVLSHTVEVIDHKEVEVLEQIASHEEQDRADLAYYRKTFLSPASINQTVDLEFQNVLRANPNLRNADPAVQNAVKAKLRERVVSETSRFLNEIEQEIDQGYSEVNTQTMQQFAAARAQARERILERTENLKTEMTFQEVAVKLGHRFGKNSLIYIQAGKFLPEAAGKVNEVNRSYIETIKTGADVPSRLLGPAPTTAVNFGIVTFFDLPNSDQAVKVRSDVYAFSDRVSFTDGNNYIGTIYTLDENEYENHQDYNLDSIIFRQLIESGNVSTYWTVADTPRGNWWGAGVDWEFIPLTHLIVNYYGAIDPETRTNGHSALQLDRGVSVYLARDVNEKTSIYAGYTNLDGYRDAGEDTNGPIDRHGFEAGVSHKLGNIPWLKFVDSKIKLGVGYHDYKFSNGDQENGAVEFTFGLSSKIGVVNRSSGNRLAELKKKRSQNRIQIADLQQPKKGQEPKTKFAAKRASNKAQKLERENIKLNAEIAELEASMNR